MRAANPIEQLIARRCTTISNLSVLICLEAGATSATVIGEQTNLLPSSANNMLRHMSKAEWPLVQKEERGKWRMTFEGTVIMEGFRRCLAGVSSGISPTSASSNTTSPN